MPGLVTKRYNTFSDELKRLFSCKVQRISVDAGFSCPNRDGSPDSAGCIFCGGHGSGSHGIRRDLDIAAQLEDMQGLSAIFWSCSTRAF